VRRPEYDTSDTYWASAGPRILSYTWLPHRNISYVKRLMPPSEEGRIRSRTVASTVAFFALGAAFSGAKAADVGAVAGDSGSNTRSPYRPRWCWVRAGL
jgi:hypothetical protein